MEEMKAFLERVEKMQEEVNVNAVFGEPRTIEGRTIIPVAEISCGFGMGFGTSGGACCEECEAEGEEAVEAPQAAGGGGGGSGARTRPIALIEVDADGTRVEPIVDEQKIALAGMLVGMWAIGWLGLVLATLFKRRT